MKFSSTVVALSAAALAYAQSNLPIINTPASLVQCQPALITFSGGVAPYFLSILPAGQPAATPIAYLPEQSAAGSYTWTVNLAAGSNITLSIRDSQGQLNYAAPLVVQSGPDSSCVGVVVSGASSGSGAGSTAAVGTSAPVSSIATTAAPSTATAVTTSGTAATNASVTAASGTPTSTINGTSATFNFTCTQGLLTYGITVAELQGVPLSEVVAYTRNWTAAAPGTALNTTGRGVGATRAYQIGTNVTIEETLRLNSTNRTTGALHQQWNFTNMEPVVFSPQLTLYDAFNDLTVYTNETSNVTSVQYFILGCFNDQAAGLTTLASLINESITYWAQQITMMGSNSSMSAAAVPAKVRRVVRL